MPEIVDPTLSRMLLSARAEAFARQLTLSLIRLHGVTVPLRTFRRQPRPMPMIDSMILSKLEAIATVIGRP